MIVVIMDSRNSVRRSNRKKTGMIKKGVSRKNNQSYNRNMLKTLIVLIKYFIIIKIDNLYKILAGYLKKEDKLMQIFKEKYIVNEKGEKIAAILPIKNYEELVENLHDLAIVAERRNETTITLVN